MPMNARPFALALTAVAGGLLAAMSVSSGIAGADVWSIETATDDGYDAPAVLSVSGMPPFDQTLIEQGYFGVYDHDLGVIDDNSGILTSTDSFGVINQDLVVNSYNLDVPDHSVIDILNFGAGYENVYADLPGLGAGGTNLITDTVVTPFGNFDVPVTFDAAALDVAISGASVSWAELLDPSGFAAALDADWTTFFTDLGGLF
jgi:hypothetical protein